MDTFLEYLMPKKDGAKDVLFKAGIVLLATILCIVVFFVFSLVAFLRSFVFFMVLLVCYGAYLWIQRLCIEYEYIFINGDLDIDIIRGKKFRKTLISIKCRNIEIMEMADNDEYPLKKKPNTKNVCAVYNPKAENIYKIIGTSDGDRAYILFQPTEKLIEEMKRYNPNNIKE